VRRPALAGLALAGIAVGVLAERQAYGWTELRSWLPDLLAGWTLIGLGIALLVLRRPPGAAALLLLAGFTWFAFNFATAGSDAVQRLAEQAAYLHRGPLLALALALPSGRPRTRTAAAGVAVAWTTAVVWPLWDSDVVALVLAAVLVVVGTVEWAQAEGRRGRSIAARGLVAVAILVAAIAADAVRSSAGGPQDVADATVLGYSLAVALAGFVLFTAVQLAAPAALAERAVALERGGARLRDALRDLLGDPRLEIGYAIGLAGPIDDLGRPFEPTLEGRVASPVAVTGRQVGVVVHDPSTLADVATRSAVFAAVGLAAERTRLRAEVARQVETVEASRRRLLAAEDQERRRLAERLERGPGAGLAEVERLLHEALPDGDEKLAAALGRATEQLERIRPELLTLVDGLGGVAAAGLVRSLERLAAGLPVQVELELEDVSATPETASALWFVCSECLANAVKHGDARSIRVALAAGHGAVRLTVEDDGHGGADPGGSGLVGLTDRVGALGGRLRIVSPPGAGTRVVAELPLGPATAGSSP
jgi:signal transduction histidine kinase